MKATTIRKRGNAWQVRVGSGKAQHSIGSFKTYEEALKAREAATFEEQDNKASNYSRFLVGLAKQMAEEAVRERKEWIEDFLIENSSSSKVLFSLAPKISEMAKQNFEEIVEPIVQKFDLNEFRNVEGIDIPTAISRIATLSNDDKEQLYKSYYEGAMGSDKDFDAWRKNLSEEDLSLLDAWLCHNWQVV